MVVVFIAARYQVLLKILLEEKYEAIRSIGIIKNTGARYYLYVDTTLSYREVISLFKQSFIKHQKCAYVYQFYSVYQGKIDYDEHLPIEYKNSMKYYNDTKKDITDEEISCYLKAQ